MHRKVGYKRGDFCGVGLLPAARLTYNSRPSTSSPLCSSIAAAAASSDSNSTNANLHNTHKHDETHSWLTNKALSPTAASLRTKSEPYETRNQDGKLQPKRLQSLLRKLSRDGAEVIRSGRLFQICQSATVNARSPTVDSRVDGTKGADTVVASH